MSHTIAICAIDHCAADTIHAMRAMIQPPMTPLQNSVVKPPSAALTPSAVSSSATSTGSAAVRPAIAANPAAPTWFATKTTTQSRAVFRRWRRSSSTRITGNSVFSVNNCWRPMMTAMKPRG